jgi:hypothetical protein
MRILGRGLLAAGVATLTCVASAQAIPVHVQLRVSVRQNPHVSFRAQRLPNGGYYYAVIVLETYKRYTRRSPPPCSTSSDMRRTDYGHPQTGGRVALALTPAKSATRHWCPSGSYEGAIYAVPHAPPCESSYPCNGEPHEEPCAGVRPGCVHGVVARPLEWSYPDPLPAPIASGTVIVGRFAIKFPAR